MSLIRKHRAVLQAWACLALVLYRTMSCNNTVMNFLYDVFGRYELQALLAKYDITGICSPRRFWFLARN